MNDDSPYDIQILNKHNFDDVDSPLLRRAISETLRRFDTVSAVLSVAVVVEEEIARLNEQYLSHKGPTDVLAFDLADESNHQYEGRKLDGEIIISADAAVRLANEKGHSPAAELALYAVHGTLHLLGLNDTGEDEAEKMHQLEDDILSAVGLGQVYGR